MSNFTLLSETLKYEPLKTNIEKSDQVWARQKLYVRYESSVLCFMSCLL